MAVHEHINHWGDSENKSTRKRLLSDRWMLAVKRLKKKQQLSEH